MIKIAYYLSLRSDFQELRVLSSYIIGKCPHGVTIAAAECSSFFEKEVFISVLQKNIRQIACLTADLDFLIIIIIILKANLSFSHQFTTQREMVIFFSSVHFISILNKGQDLSVHLCDLIFDLL